MTAALHGRATMAKVRQALGLESQAHAKIEAVEIAIGLKPLVVDLEHDMRRRVEIRADRRHPIVILRPVAVVAGIG